MPQITDHTVNNFVTLPIIQCVNLVVHPSGYNGSLSQQSLQWTHLDKHQS